MLAWHTAALTRSARMPSLQSLLDRANGKAPKQQTAQEMKEAIRGLVGEFKQKRRLVKE